MAKSEARSHCFSFRALLKVIVIVTGSVAYWSTVNFRAQQQISIQCPPPATVWHKDFSIRYQYPYDFSNEAIDVPVSCRQLHNRQDANKIAEQLDASGIAALFIVMSVASAYTALALFFAEAVLRGCSIIIKLLLFVEYLVSASATIVSATVAFFWIQRVCVMSRVAHLLDICKEADSVCFVNSHDDWLLMKVSLGCGIGLAMAWLLNFFTLSVVCCCRGKKHSNKPPIVPSLVVNKVVKIDKEATKEADSLKEASSASEQLDGDKTPIV